MYPPKVIVVLSSLLVGAVQAETESLCGAYGGASTVTITETVSPVTVTVNIASVPFSISTDSGVSAVVPESWTDITATLTSYATIINVLSVIEASSSPVKSNEGPYSFAEHSGSTSWLGGKTPPATASFVVKTSAITVSPVPEYSLIPSGAAPDSSSFSTLTLTSTTSKIFTKTLTESFSTPEPSAKPFTGLAPHGWNSSVTTFRTVKVGPTGKASVYATAGPSISARWDVPPPLQGIDPHFPVPPNWPVYVPPVDGFSYIEPRQVGAVVVATIEGQVVSWTNSYDGGVSVTATSESIPSSSASPTVTLGAYPWDLPAVSPSQVTSSSSASPTIVVGAYPWDLSPVQTASISSILTVTSASTPTVSSFSSWELQPGVYTMQPSMDTSYLSSALKISPTSPSATVVATSSTKSPPATTTTTSEFSLISLIPGPTAAANGTSATGTATAPHPSCSDKSPFTIDFDDLPHFSIGNNPNDTDIPPIFNPYRKLYWENHFGYVPPPTDPFPPISGKQLAVYHADDVNVDGSPDAGLELYGEFGSGPRAKESAYWIDAYSVYLGCSNAGPSDCVITINGYETAHSIRVAFQTVTQPPCPGLINCKLAKVSFNENFRNLSGIQIIAAVDRRPTTWYMDDLELGWSSNTCEATTERNNNR